MSAQRSAGSQSERAVPGGRLPALGPAGTDPAGPGAGAAPVVALSATPRISGGCSWQVVEGEAVLLDLHGRRILGLNRVGSFVFPLLDGARTVGGLAASIAERFGVEVRKAEADLRVFLAELARRGFVEGVER
ncbi:MAG TPA: PqqD family protein [Anaeromyxobacter sp.]|nr:PqqD family protein [Anaeromyxobacter sp.]